MTPMTPDYWNDAKKHLGKRCPVMKKLIAHYTGEGGLAARGDGFYSLLRAIVGQQISVKAADAVWGKLEKAVKPLTPENLLRKREATLRKCGLSGQKVAYVRNVAEFFRERGIALTSSPLEGERDNARLLESRGVIRGGIVSAALPPTETPKSVSTPPQGGSRECVARYWDHFSDEEIVAQLTSIKGIGSWTAEMFLIFHLLRPNVFPVKDFGVLKAIDLHYTGGKRLKPKEYEALAERWQPYRTVASWYLWRSLDPVPVAY